LAGIDIWLEHNTSSLSELLVKKMLALIVVFLTSGILPLQLFAVQGLFICRLIAINFLENVLQKLPIILLG